MRRSVEIISTLVVMVTVMAGQADAVCCPTLPLTHKSLNSLTNEAFCSLARYPVHDIRYFGYCIDGVPLYKGYYCGNGPCNVFGCNCDGGCRTDPPFVPHEICNGILPNRSAITNKILMERYQVTRLP